MHAAICDDNVADRRQLERLLKRESDKRSADTGIIYADAFGNVQALLANPMQYDIFYIDMCKSGEVTGTIVAKKLCDIGVQVPIYMCCSYYMNYRQESFPENVFFIDKPIKVDHLIASLDHAYEVKQNAVPRIELRDETKTYYITADDILYGIASGKHVQVHLADGRVIHVASGIENLYGQWEHHQVFIITNSKTIINICHIDHLGLLHVYMKDGNRLSIQPSTKHIIQQRISSNS